MPKKLINKIKSGSILLAFFTKCHQETVDKCDRKVPIVSSIGLKLNLQIKNQIHSTAYVHVQYTHAHTP